MAMMQTKMQTPQFGGFQPTGKAKIARSMGFQGPLEQFDKFLQDNPDRQAEMMRYEDFARKMVSGGYVAKMQEGGMPKSDVVPPDYDPPVYGGPARIGELELDELKTEAQPQSIGQISAELMDTPSLPQGAAVTPVGTVVTDQQLVPTGSGQVDPRANITASTAQTTQAQIPQQTQASTLTPTTSAQDVATALNSNLFSKV